ncbi:MAG: sulfatase [Candidatus Omnitrophica bacterium]|nr:sulfatase [Candidatus Omnitrophota bacterium]
MVRKITLVLFFVLIASAICASPYFSKKKTNVVIIVIDSLRPDHLSCYGYPRNTSPNIDQLAQKSIQFTQAISASGWTFESVPSILTGTYPPMHQVRKIHDLRNPGIDTLFRILNPKGYKCAFWSNQGGIRYTGIEDALTEFHIKDMYNRYEPLTLDQELVIETRSWIERQKKNKPLFVYIHLHGPHAPYRPPSPYKDMFIKDIHRKPLESVPISVEEFNGDGFIPLSSAENNITDPNYYIARYDGAIAYADAQVGRLLGGLKDRGLFDDTLIILTADHGEYLGEHKLYFNHGEPRGGFEENIKVPLLIKLPGKNPANKIITRQVSLVDIAPTVLESVGLHRPSYMQGESLLCFVKPFRDYAKDYALSFFENKTWIVFRAAGWKLIHNYADDFWQLYDLKKDPGENHNLINDNPEKFAELRQRLDALKGRITASTPDKKSPVSEEKLKEDLKSLGYAQ